MIRVWAFFLGGAALALALLGPIVLVVALALLPVLILVTGAYILLYICEYLLHAVLSGLRHLARALVNTLLVALAGSWGYALYNSGDIRSIAFVLACTFILGLGFAFARQRISARAKTSGRSLVVRAPGMLVLSLFDCISRRATSELIRQMVADMQYEYFDALAAGRPNRARWLLVLHYVAIARALTVDRAIGAAIGYVVGVLRAGKP